jgi:hypothetical protein
MNRELSPLKLEGCNKNLQEWGRNDGEIKLLRVSRNITTHGSISVRTN